jgi:hypothetical protein
LEVENLKEWNGLIQYCIRRELIVAKDEIAITTNALPLVHLKKTPQKGRKAIMLKKGDSV